jgi:hypothetical protein
MTRKDRKRLAFAWNVFGAADPFYEFGLNDRVSGTRYRSPESVAYGAIKIKLLRSQPHTHPVNYCYPLIIGRLRWGSWDASESLNPSATRRSNAWKAWKLQCRLSHPWNFKDKTETYSLDYGLTSGSLSASYIGTGTISGLDPRIQVHESKQTKFSSQRATISLTVYHLYVRYSSC